MRSALFWVITRRLVVIYYQRFATIYRSHLQWSKIQKESRPLKMEPIGCPEKSVKNYHCVMTQKSAVLIYFAAETSLWSHL
jgi:hypothetical protein